MLGSFSHSHMYMHKCMESGLGLCKAIHIFRMHDVTSICRSWILLIKTSTGVTETMSKI